MSLVNTEKDWESINLSNQTFRLCISDTELIVEDYDLEAQYLALSLAGLPVAKEIALLLALKGIMENPRNTQSLKDILVTFKKEKRYTQSEQIKKLKNSLACVHFIYSARRNLRLSAALNPHLPDWLISNIILYGVDETEGVRRDNLEEYFTHRTDLTHNQVRFLYQRSKNNPLLISPLLKNPKVPAKVLSQAYIDHPQYHDKIALHPNTPGETLLELRLRFKGVYSHPNMPQEHIKEHMNVYSEAILMEVSKNPNISHSVALFISQKPITSLRMSLAANSSVAVSILEELSHDPTIEVRRRIASNPHTPHHVFEELLKEEKMHSYLLKNSWVPDKIIRKIKTLNSPYLYDESLLLENKFQ